MKKSAFPARFACFDAGSNAVRFVIVEYSDPTHYKVVFKQRKPVRLFSLSTQNNSLSQEAMQVVVQFFQKSKAMMEDYQVTSYRAVATSAVRESDDGRQFCDMIEKKSGLHLEIIDSKEEARLMYIAVKNKVDLNQHHWFLFEIGGGSVQVSIINAKAVVWTSSRPIGAVRLWETFHTADSLQESLVPFVRSEFIKMDIPTDSKIRGCFATGGSVEEALRLSGQSVHSGSIGVLSREKIKQIKKLLSALSIEQRVAQLGLMPDRADIMLPAMMVVDEFCTLLRLSSIYLPFTSLRDGILQELANHYFDSGDC